MTRLIKQLCNKPDLVRLLKKVRVVKLDYGWKFKGREEGYIDISCGRLKLRVNGFEIINNTDNAYALLVKEARAFGDYLGIRLKFKASYFGRRYKKFDINLQ